jgi:hypothetical protein
MPESEMLRRDPVRCGGRIRPLCGNLPEAEIPTRDDEPQTPSKMRSRYIRFRSLSFLIALDIYEEKP